MRQIAVMLGGNLPGSASAFARALEKFAAAGVGAMRVSPPVSSSAEDCVPGTPDFLDQAFTGVWAGSPEELLALAKAEGFELSHEEAEKYFAQLSGQALSLDEIDKVAGGCLSHACIGDVSAVC